MDRWWLLSGSSYDRGVVWHIAYECVENDKPRLAICEFRGHHYFSNTPVQEWLHTTRSFGYEDPLGFWRRWTGAHPDWGLCDDCLFLAAGGLNAET